MANFTPSQIHPIANCMRAKEVKTPVAWELEKAMDSGRRLKEMGWDKQRIFKGMEKSKNFNMTVAARALEQLFESDKQLKRAA